MNIFYKIKGTALTVPLIKMGCTTWRCNGLMTQTHIGSIPIHSTIFYNCKDTKPKLKNKCF